MITGGPGKLHPMALREVHGCRQFWKRAGSEFLDFGVWPLGLRPADSGVSRHNDGVPRGAGGTATRPAQPIAPVHVVTRAPWASVPAIPIAG